MDEIGGACDVFLRREVHVGLWCENLKKIERLENVSSDERVVLKFTLKK
jgi:hypothetical protein